jgi:hypothetical protein
VTGTTDVGLLEAEDADPVAFGLAQGRVLFTPDADVLIPAAGVWVYGTVASETKTVPYTQTPPRPVRKLWPPV